MPAGQSGQPGRENERRGHLAAMRRLNPLLTAGIQLAASVVLMFFVGQWLDGKFGTTPWMVLAGIVFGTAAGFYQFFRAVNDVSRREQQDRTSNDTTTDDR